MRISQLPKQTLLELTAEAPEPQQSEVPDETWARRLTAIFERLQRSDISGIPAERLEWKERGLQAFFEVYFSNYIEGTEFTVAEAESIVFSEDLGCVPENRISDVLELIRAWQYATGPIGRSWSINDFDEFLAKVKQSHEELFRDQKLLRPGRFKVLPNVAGTSQFVAPDKVVATLKLGFELAQRLPAGVQRAVMLHHALIGVHLFVDGNGRTTRMVMNAHLTDSGECRIMVPIGHYVRYLDALEDTYVLRKPLASSQFLATMQKWTASVRWADLSETERQLEALGAMRDANKGQVPFDQIMFGDEE